MDELGRPSPGPVRPAPPLIGRRALGRGRYPIEATRSTWQAAGAGVRLPALAHEPVDLFSAVQRRVRTSELLTGMGLRPDEVGLEPRSEGRLR